MFKPESLRSEQEKTAREVADFLASMVIKAAKGEVSEEAFNQAVLAAREVIEKARGNQTDTKESVN